MVRLLINISENDIRLIESDFVTAGAKPGELHAAVYSKSLDARQNYKISAPDKSVADMLMSELLSKGYADASDYPAEIEK